MAMANGRSIDRSHKPLALSHSGDSVFSTVKIVYWRRNFEGRLNVKRNVLIGTGLPTLLVVPGVGQVLPQQAATAQTNGKTMAPRFEVDPMWPKPLPNHWLL